MGKLGPQKSDTVLWYPWLNPWREQDFKFCSRTIHIPPQLKSQEDVNLFTQACSVGATKSTRIYRTVLWFQKIAWPPFTQDARRDAQCNASKLDLLSSMGVFTLHASNNKGFAFEFAVRVASASYVNEALGLPFLLSSTPQNKVLEATDDWGFLRSFDSPWFLVSLVFAFDRFHSMLVAMFIMENVSNSRKSCAFQFPTDKELFRIQYFLSGYN